MTLSALFELYGNRNAINETVLDYAVKSIMQDFSHISIEEIPEAFNLWSKNIIGGSEPYGGEFNLLVINRILSDYDKYRKTQRSELFDKIKTEREKRENEEKEMRDKNKFYSNIEEEIKQPIRKAKKWQEIPGWIFKSAEKRGFIKLTISEKNEILIRAIEEEYRELREELYFCKDRGRVKKIDEILKSGSGTDRSKIIAGKMAIWENRDKILKSCL